MSKQKNNNQKTEKPDETNPELLYQSSEVMTEQNRDAEAVQKSRQRLSLLFEKAPYCAFISSLERGVIEDVNEAFTTVLGYTKQEAVGKDALELGIYPDPEAWRRSIAEVQKKGVLHNYKLQLRTKSGELREFSVNMNFIEIGSEKFTLTTAQDITERKRAEQALKESEQRSRTLVENLPQKIFVKDRRSVYITCNENYARDLGIIPAEITGKDDFNFYPPELAEKYRADDRRIMESGATEELEEKYLIDGKEFWVNTVKVPVRDQNGSVTGIIGIFWDITERKHAETALKESEAKFKNVFESANVGKSLTLPTGEVDVNKAFADMLGYTQDELKGKTWKDLTPVDDIETIQNLINPLLTGEKDAVRFNKRYIHKNGSYIWTDVSAAMRRDAQGKPLHFITTIVDISEQKRAEDARRESEARFRSVFENATIGLYRTTPEGQIILANPAILRMLGFESVEELSRRGSTSQGYMDPAEAEEFHRRINAEGEIRGFETAWRHKNGTPVYVRESAQAVRDAEGKILYYEGTVEDITEYKLLEEQFHQAMKMEAVGRLAGGVAHDFNNLLTVISGHTDLMELSINPRDPLKEDLEAIQEAIKRASGLTNQLLVFSRKQVVEAKVVDLNEEIANMAKMLRRLIGEDVILQQELAPDLGKVKIDPGLFGQAVINLAVNARDAMPQGGRLTVSTQKEFIAGPTLILPEISTGDYAVVSVSDTGTGMSKEVLERIYEPFFTTKAAGKGTGLGLSMVFGVIKQSDGHIAVESEVGRGTTFKIYLPIISDTDDDYFSDKTEAAALPRGSETILLVEDEDEVRHMSVRILKKQGYKIYEASTGGDAYLLFQQPGITFDLILTDVIMPNVSGPRLVELIHKMQPGLKVLFMTGYTDTALDQYPNIRESFPFLLKPFRPRELALKVREVLDG